MEPEQYGEVIESLRSALLRLREEKNEVIVKEAVEKDAVGHS
jgi:hypothetical protein